MPKTIKSSQDDKVVYEATVTSKGQITLPTKFRQANGLTHGDKVKLIQDTASGNIQLEISAPEDSLTWDEILKDIPTEVVQFNKDGTVNAEKSPNFAAWMKEDDDD
ncbi:AbrB/MazE/SpoVT family DNA-binding domain-containing protein [Lactiplantibacillus xiangfangensis]|uniref:SpoVT-AbrB domain-containing protein n=1 Tax=Lactiplantibacillus xiangfangensis TaxID=942150 RepID=A0A0R2MSB1_9LACO|nr:AbrB/MazE/SpoVT family DNA-binding domain-containing protein [Lactiplantibacillus xiangfangensis]KRO14371.1 hypothetical protein IV64_GL001665 [Lactiplantibacillus xiangfangensis]